MKITDNLIETSLNRIKNLRKKYSCTVFGRSKHIQANIKGVVKIEFIDSTIKDAYLEKLKFIV